MKSKQEDDCGKTDGVPIYGGIIGLSKYQEEVLQLPPNHRIFPKLKLEEFRTELEKCVVKANWQKTREQRQQEDINRKSENDDARTDDSNDKTNVIDFRNLRATDLKNNKRIVYPKPDADDEEEIRRNNVKRELEKVFVNYMNENCDKFGNVTENNLSEKQVKAIKTLKEKMKDEDLVCFETDKTGKFALDRKQNYIDKMRKHIIADEIISMKEVKKIEKELNEHAEHLVRITNTGLNTNQAKRIKGNLKTNDNQIPILSGTHKDHKKVDDKNIGPDVRPIMGATVGPNIALTDFIARSIIRKVAEEASVGNDCKSTEELLNKFEEYNHVIVQKGYSTKNVMIASMDIDKWFPSMKIRPMTKEIKQMIIDSGIEFKEIDYENAAR